MSLSLEQLIVELDKIAAAPHADGLANDDVRARLRTAARRASLALEQSTDVVTRALLSHPVESTLVNIALNLELFSKLLHPDRSPKSLAYLAAATGRMACSLVIGKDRLIHIELTRQQDVF